MLTLTSRWQTCSGNTSYNFINKCHYNNCSLEQEILDGTKSALCLLMILLKLKAGKGHHLQLCEKQTSLLDQIVWMWYQQGYLLSPHCLLLRHCGEVSHLRSLLRTGNWNQNKSVEVQLPMQHFIRTTRLPSKFISLISALLYTLIRNF